MFWPYPGPAKKVTKSALAVGYGLGALAAWPTHDGAAAALPGTASAAATTDAANTVIPRLLCMVSLPGCEGRSDATRTRRRPRIKPTPPPCPLDRTQRFTHAAKLSTRFSAARSRRV